MNPYCKGNNSEIELPHSEFNLPYPQPIQQKEHSKHHTRYPIGGHKGKVHPAQIVWLYETVLVDQHGAKETYADIVRPAKAMWYKKYRCYNKCSGEYMQ